MTNLERELLDALRLFCDVNPNTLSIDEICRRHDVARALINKIQRGEADDICLTCRHSRIDHSDFVGPCDYIKWIEGHPEYRCMCRTFVKKNDTVHLY